MKTNEGIIRVLFALFTVVGIAAAFSAPVYAHCDGMDGPVVKAAQTALANGDVNLVLIWVRKNDEPEIRQAFERTVNVRKLSPQAKELADMHFFETLVRIHRAGEGAPYTGLKLAGRDLGPAIPAADQALKSGDMAPLTKLLVEQMRTGLMDRYKQAMAAKGFKTQDIDAGREYVEKYVTFIHYVEGMYEAATRSVSGHYPESTGGHEER
ncbi:MAG TPA: DUF6448 family protein [Acidobacteriota bacterium]|nr:DUF6448 family protein [Acidobacteriota bacterium]